LSSSLLPLSSESASLGLESGIGVGVASISFVWGGFLGSHARFWLSYSRRGSR
jgi:hypothetical protein